jgi:hypothetical protein
VKAITALKKGRQFLKYWCRRKPKFCLFRLSNDETLLIWYFGREENKLWLNTVSRIVPGQSTAIFQRYPRPEKEYQSFSLIHGNEECSVDVVVVHALKLHLATQVSPILVGHDHNMICQQKHMTTGILSWVD